MYITMEEYTALYDPMEEKRFHRLAFDACRVMDIHTTGIDGLKKLKRFFPTDEDAAQAVKHCAARLIDFLNQVDLAEKAELESRGYDATGQGLRGKVITSVSAGNESISYSTGGSAASTAIDTAVKDKTARDRMMAEVVREYLSGVTDDNGVNLLFMGPYPRRCLC